MSSTLLYPNWREKVVFSAQGVQPQVLWDDGKLKGLLAGLEPGQALPPHPEHLAMYHFLEGTGWMTVDGERYAVGAGATLFVPEGGVRGVEAESRLVFLAARVA